MALNQFPTSNTDEWWDDFRRLLDDRYEWPNVYLFKFIVPKRGIDELSKVFAGSEIDIKASSKGNYLSVTSRARVHSSREVTDIYQRAGAIEGVISL